MERFPDLAIELARLKVDVIVGPGPVLPALKQATPTIPVVMVGAAAPVQQGLVHSLARPGGNVTGLSFQLTETTGKRLELLKELVPGAAPVVLPSAPLAIHCKRLVERAARNRLPALYISMRECVIAGGLMSYGTNSLDLFPRLAIYVDKLLKGARPGALPVEQPTKFELIINLAAAKSIGLTIPQPVLVRADQVLDK